MWCPPCPLHVPFTTPALAPYIMQHKQQQQVGDASFVMVLTTASLHGPSLPFSICCSLISSSADCDGIPASVAKGAAPTTRRQQHRHGSCSLDVAEMNSTFQLQWSSAAAACVCLCMRHFMLGCDCTSVVLLRHSLSTPAPVHAVHVGLCRAAVSQGIHHAVPSSDATADIRRSVIIADAPS